MGFENDLLQSRAVAFNYALMRVLQAWGISPTLEAWVPPVLGLVEELVLVLVLAAVAERVERMWRDRPVGAQWMPVAPQAAIGLCALVLLYWTYRHPSGDLAGFVCRWDYLAFAILAGVPLRRLPLRARVWTLAVLSLVLVIRHVGRIPVLIVLSGCLIGFAAERSGMTNGPARRAAVQGMLMAAVFAVLWQHRWSNPLAALQGWGLYAFVAFRHVSFVVESGRGVPATLCDYLCFLLFYPSCIGAMEVYHEFRERNLDVQWPPEYRRAALTVTKGIVLLWIAVMIPMDDNRFVESVGFAETWRNNLVLFLRAGCGTMGIWNIIEGGALFLDVRLRPNFRGVLTATNPSQFWRAWRGTMTNWLIRYVYIPLGGNRRHQTINILGAFAVSTVWHCLGPPFLRPTTWRPYDLVPLVMWGTINFVAVASHAAVRRRWPAVEPRPPLRAALGVLKWPLTMCFASMTTCLLGFGLGHLDRFAHVVRSLVGLEGW